MARAYARFRLPDGRTFTLFPGDLIGRLWSAALPLEDSRVSEAHAMLSLRGEHLCLLPLRGRVLVEGQDRPSLQPIPLQAGQRMMLHAALALTVETVVLPERALAVALPGLPPQLLAASVYSLLSRPQPHLLAEHQASALAWIWSTGEGWKLERAGGGVEPLTAGLRLEIGGFHLDMTALPRQAAAVEQTEGWLHTPLHIVACWDTAHIHREGHPTLSLSRISAKILSSLIRYEATPMPWWEVMRQIEEFQDEPCLRRGVDFAALDAIETNPVRYRWDRNLAALRHKLRASGIVEKDGARRELVRSDGKNNVELVLLPGDTLEDRT